MFLKRRFVLICGALALFGSLTSGSAWAGDWKTLPGHVPSAVARLTSAGTVKDTNQMRLAIGVPLRDPAGLDQFLAELYDPASPNYRKFLTPETFTARFGPTEHDYEAVKRFARENGLTAVQTHSNRLVLDVTGPAVAVERALHIRLQTYQHPSESRKFFAPDTEPIVAMDLPVADIQGLSDFSKPHPKLIQADADLSPHTGTGAGGSYLGSDFRAAYALGTTMTGAGQKVGLLQFDGFYPSDIAAYAAAAGAGRANIAVETVLLDGYNGTPTHSGGSSEVALDIEMAMAMAPGLSKIIVYEAGPAGLANDVLNAMAADSDVKSLSCSWGWTGGPSTTMDNIFKQLAAQGQSFFSASGDSAAFTVGASSVNGVDNPSVPNAPSSSPYITVVGGTTLTMGVMGSSYGSEVVWNWGGGTGSSGGISSRYGIPDWQSGVSMSANKGSASQRNTPDVALTAAGVTVYYNNGARGTFGGTSCASPLWAGFMALVNQQAALNGNPAPGFINPAVYAIGLGQNTNYSYAECFHDITTGNNFWSSSPAGYPAVPGYDLCTGWGSPNGVKLINALAGSGGITTISTNTNTTTGPTNTVTSITNSLVISPLTGFAFTGVVGGPFTPDPAIFQLTNDSAYSLNWSLVSTSAWLKVQSTNGSVDASSGAGVAVNISAAANTLKIGSYSTSLAFTNLATHAGKKIKITLVVAQPMSLDSTNGFTAFGPVGGGFYPSSQDFVIKNSSASALKWGLVKSATWLTVSASAGTNAPGGQSVVTVGLAASAKTLRAAIYNATVRFTNSAGIIATVPVTLSVGQPLVQNGGFENGSFSGWTQAGNTAFTSISRLNAYYRHTGNYGAQLGPADPSYLSQTIRTVPGQTYRLSLWLRNSSGGIPNSFQIQWDGNTAYDLEDFATKTWTNLQTFVTATSAATVLQFAFDDERGYLGLDDISLTPVASSSAKIAVQKTGDFQVIWNSTPGGVYQAQYKTNLCQPGWINLGAPISASADTLIMTDTNAFHYSAQRFYRLLPVSP